jgi:hypothetical protein
MIYWFLLLGVGQVLIFVWERFPLKTKSEFFTKLHECGLCSGVWIFSFLAFALRVNFIQLIGIDFYLPVASEVITGAVSSFLMWLLVAGWNSKFNVVVIR